MTFGIGRIDYTALYGTERTIASATNTVDGPNKGTKFNLAHLPSDSVVTQEYGKAAATDLDNTADLTANKTYIVVTPVNPGVSTNEHQYEQVSLAAKMRAKSSATFRYNDSNGDTITLPNNMLAGDVLVTNAAIETTDMDGIIRLKQVNDSSNAFKAGHEYEIVSFGSGQNTDASKTVVANTFKDVDAIGRAVSGINDGDILKVGQKFTVDADASVAELAHLNALTEGMSFRQSSDTLTKDIEAMQSLVNTARVQAGSQYAAIESAVNYTTDLTAQYELGYNIVNDVNFSMETAHLAKNQILQQAAIAMLAQANAGQQGLLQLIS